MSTSQHFDGHDANDGVLELAPTTVIDTGRPQTAGPQVELLTGSRQSLSSKTTSLLYDRLQAVTILMLVVYAMVLVWALADQTVTGKKVVQDVLRIYRDVDLVRLVFLGAVLALLMRARSFSQTLLRGIEYSLFGVLTLLWIFARYEAVLIDANAGDITDLLLDGRTAMIGLFTLIIVHGMFIPHRWYETASVVLTMTLAPVFVLIFFEVRHPELAQQVAELMSWHYVTTNTLIMLVGAVLATYASNVLNNLRHNMHEAEQYGQYQLLRKLGSGGMGDVFLAEHILMKRPCALKLIQPKSSTDQMALARFEREVKTTSGLTHPHTIEIYDYGHTDNDTFYYVMEYLPGLSLEELLSEYGPLPPGRVIYLLRQACGALAEAHAAGLIHRDLKPGNLYISERGGQCDYVKVLDFGLVKLMHEPAGTKLTSDHVISGTPLYMAPEQAMGDQALDARCDLYALGAIAYHMLTGHPPFEHESPMAVLIAHAREEVSPLTSYDPQIPEDLQQIVLRCLAKLPEDRYGDALELERALSACSCSEDWDSQKAATWWHDICFTTTTSS
jgi:serine/threonine-protein kinase